MKRQIFIYIQILFLFSLLHLISNSCKKDRQSGIPVLLTVDVTNITEITAVCGGNIISEGNATITNRGICWSINTTPSIADNKTVDGAGAGSFISNISGLEAKTTYFVRAYATNSYGTGYGDAMSFTSLVGQLPVLYTSPISQFDSISAVCGGNIILWGITPVTSRGVCWDTILTPTINSSKTHNGEGGGKFTSSITGLLENTNYNVRAYATNRNGTSYGSMISFKTLITNPGPSIIGQWQFVESFKKSTLNQTYLVNISQDPNNSSQVIIGNLGNPGSLNITVKGIVSSDKIVVSLQNMGNGWIIEGSGITTNVSKTSMTWTYSISAGGNKDDYTATASKR